MAKDNDVYNFEQKDKVTKVGKFIRKNSTAAYKYFKGRNVFYRS